MRLMQTPKPPDRLYKYFPADRIDVLTDGRIRFTQPSSFNDPFDCRTPFSLGVTIDTMYSCRVSTGPIGPWANMNRDQGFRNTQHRSLRDMLSWETVDGQGIHGESKGEEPLSGRLQVRVNNRLNAIGGFAARQAARSLGILSLSERWDSGLMWSHYAQSYRGFVIGFNSNHPFIAGQDSPAMPESPEMLVEGFSGVATGPAVLPVTYLEDRVPHIPNIHASQVITYADCLFKGNDWAYEREWRAFRTLRARDAIGFRKRGVFKPYVTGKLDEFRNSVVLYELPTEAVEEVIVGTSMSYQDRARIANIIERDASLARVHLSVIHLSVDGYRLERLALTSEQLLAARHANDTGGYEEQLRWEFRVTLNPITPGLLIKLRDMLRSGALSPLSGVEGQIFMEMLDETIDI